MPYSSTGLRFLRPEMDTFLHADLVALDALLQAAEIKFYARSPSLFSQAMRHLPRSL